jgi:hypothetical protein
MSIPSALRVMFALALILLCAPANAFRSNDVESYTDPDYQGYVPKKIVLLVADSSNDVRQQIETRLKEELGDLGITIISYRELFPPTRTWTTADQEAIYQRENVDSGLIITVGSRSSEVIPIATNTYTTGNIFGSYGAQGTFKASGSSNSTTYNVVGARSEAEFSAVLLDLAKNRTAWYADITVKAAGTFFVGSKGDAKGAVAGVIKGLGKDGHLPPK